MTRVTGGVMPKRSTTPISVDWTAIKVEFVNSHATFEELAKKYGVKAATLRQRAKRHGWADERHKITQTVTAEAPACKGVAGDGGSPDQRGNSGRKARSIERG